MKPKITTGLCSGTRCLCYFGSHTLSRFHQLWSEEQCTASWYHFPASCRILYISQCMWWCMYRIKYLRPLLSSRGTRASSTAFLYGETAAYDCMCVYSFGGLPVVHNPTTSWGYAPCRESYRALRARSRTPQTEILKTSCRGEGRTFSFWRPSVLLFLFTNRMDNKLWYTTAMPILPNNMSMATYI